MEGIHLATTLSDPTRGFARFEQHRSGTTVSLQGLR